MWSFNTGAAVRSGLTVFGILCERDKLRLFVGQQTFEDAPLPRVGLHLQLSFKMGDVLCCNELVREHC